MVFGWEYGVEECVCVEMYISLILRYIKKDGNLSKLHFNQYTTQDVTKWMYTQIHKWLPAVNRNSPPPPKLQGGVAVEAESVHCYKYCVVDLQIIMYIRRHVTLVYPIYLPLFAFQPEHSLEASCLLTLLVLASGWGEIVLFILGSHL